jgi:diguanylate cyclase (GGDEF)-like protein
VKTLALVWFNASVSADGTPTSDTSGRAGGVWFAVAVAAFLLAVAYVVFAAFTTSDLTDARDDAPLWVLGAVGAVSLLGWWRDRARRSAAEAEARRERERLESELHQREDDLRETREQLRSARDGEARQGRSREQLESKLQDREKALGRERYLHTRTEEAREAERVWSRELQAEVMRMHRELGALGDPSDVPAMVLRLSKSLVGAEKGLLLSREDEDSDGKLDLVSYEGFENDPGSSAIAQRFANEVIESDQIIREDAPQEVDGESAPVDEEIQNLVAIPIYIQDRFGGVIVCANKEGGFGEYDEEVLLSLGNQAGAVLNNGRLQGELRSSYLATVRVLGEAMEAKDPFLRGHSEDVSGYVTAVADRLGLEPLRREQLLFASLLHDVGKIGISELILLKPAPLTPEELNIVKLHPRIGYRIVQQVPALDPMALGILHHHERFDGTGYPSGLREEEIPLEARIICVADAFSAMTTERPYRRRLSLAEACAELERNAGTQFDPEIVRVFVDEVRKNPPDERGLRALEAALDDPVLRRNDGEPILGHATLALVDNLTLLYTRRYFHEAARAEARRAEARGRPFGVVLVDLAGIARINTQKGYAAGDEAIREAARAVQRAAVRHGGTACRHGGSRLGIIFPRTDEGAAKLLAVEVEADLMNEAGPVVATAAAASWRPGDDGESVIARARAGLDLPPADR